MSDSLLSLWYEALSEPIGIVVSCSDPVLARAKLYAERRAAADPALDVLTIRPSKFHADELWIMRHR